MNEANLELEERDWTRTHAAITGAEPAGGKGAKIRKIRRFRLLPFLLGIRACVRLAHERAERRGEVGKVYKRGQQAGQQGGPGECG